MQQYDRLEILSKIKNSLLIPIFACSNPKVLQEVFKACIQGGAEVFEYLNRGEEALKHFKTLKSFVKKHFENIPLGVGSIIQKENASLYIEAGADFIVEPALDEEIAFFCNQKK